MSQHDRCTFACMENRCGLYDINIINMYKAVAAENRGRTTLCASSIGGGKLQEWLIVL